MKHHLRIARPVRDLARTRAMYCAGLGLRVVGTRCVADRYGEWYCSGAGGDAVQDLAGVPWP